MKKVLATLVLLLVLLQVRLWTGAGSVSEIRLLESGIDGQVVENVGLELRNQELKDEVSDLRTGLDAIEERARSELGLIRRGETFFLMVDDLPQEVQDQEDILAPATEPEAEPAPAFESGAEPGIFTTPESETRTNPALVSGLLSEALPEPAPEPPPVEEEEDSNPYLELFRDDAAGDSGR